MGKIFSNNTLPVLALVLLSACSQEGDPGPVRGESGASAAESAAKGADARNPTREEAALAKAQEALEEGNQLLALRQARMLMDSGNADIRSGTVEIFSWIGRHAMPELVEMAADSDPRVAEDALNGWCRALDEMEGDEAIADAIVHAAVKLKDNANATEAILQRLVSIDETNAVMRLSELITDNPGTVLGESAREAYTLITGGEIFSTPDDTREYIRKACKGNEH